MSKTRVQPTDDHGATVALQAFNLPRKSPKKLRKLRNSICLFDSNDIHWTVAVGMISIWAVPVVALTITDQLTPDRHLPEWALYVAMVVTATIVIGSWRFVPFVAGPQQRELNRRAIDAWAGTGLCPACGYDLALDLHNGDATPDNDDTASCPQCHAKWQAARFEAAIKTRSGDWRQQWREQHPASD